DRNAWRSDLRRITRLYQSRGFYQAEILEDEILTRDGDSLQRRRELPDAVRLRVQVREGTPTLVEHLEVRGLEDLPEEHQRSLLYKLPLRSGDVFEEERWNALKDGLVARLREGGYAEASV